MASLSMAAPEDGDSPEGTWHCLYGFMSFSLESVCFLEFLLGILESHGVLGLALPLEWASGLMCVFSQPKAVEAGGVCAF